MELRLSADFMHYCWIFDFFLLKLTIIWSVTYVTFLEEKVFCSAL